jgi:hypothetical protein
MRYALILVLAAATAAQWAGAQAVPRVYYVAPSGVSTADGGLERPLELAAALGPGSPARPGDTIVLRGGLYRGEFTSVLTGAEGSPIVVRQYDGERATIDGRLIVRGAWAWYWGFEVTNSNPDRTRARQAGVTVFGPNTKLINLVIHDAGDGIGFWTPAVDAEVYGCIVYRNGWQGPEPDRGHGHSLYVQNETGVKRMVDNILFNGYSYGIHAYGEQGSLKGMHIEGNIIFNSGMDARNQWRLSNILIGGRTPAERITVVNNHTYHPVEAGATNYLGWASGPNNKDIVVKGNYFAGGGIAATAYRWESIEMTGNTLYAFPELIHVIPPKDLAWSYEIDRNSYVFAGRRQALNLDNRLYDFLNWQEKTGFDRNSQWIANSAGRAAGLQVFFRPNRFEPGRVHVAVYNWDKRDSVPIDPQGVLAPGSAFELRPVQDYFGEPVVTGVYDGGTITIPMVGTDSGPEFNAFLLTSRRAQLPPRQRPAR